MLAAVACLYARLFLPGGGVVAAEGVQFAVGADDVGAAAVDAVFIPGRGIHERLDEQAESVRFVQLEFLEQFAQGLRFAAAFHKVFEFVANLSAQKSLHIFEIDEIAHGADFAANLQ